MVAIRHKHDFIFCFFFFFNDTATTEIYTLSLHDALPIYHVVMDPVKVQGVTDWLQPVKVKDVQSFIGFVNFYRRFIRNFCEIAHPLHMLTQKSKDSSWGAAEQQAFDALKSTITSTPMLALPSKSGP